MLNITGVDAVQQNVRYHNLISVLYLWVMYVLVITIPGDPGAGRKENLSHPGSPRIGKIISRHEKKKKEKIHFIDNAVPLLKPDLQKAIFWRSGFNRGTALLIKWNFFFQHFDHFSVKQKCKALFKHFSGIFAGKSFLQRT